jgi:hypothetical protein
LAALQLHLAVVAEPVVPFQLQQLAAAAVLVWAAQAVQAAQRAALVVCRLQQPTALVAKA